MTNLSVCLAKYKKNGAEKYIKQLAQLAKRDIQDKTKVGIAVMAVLNQAAILKN
jgi:hypothetical protein